MRYAAYGVISCMKIFATFALCLAGFSASTSAPNFTLTDAAGKRVRLSDYRGKVVVLDFWATWCHGCKEEIPWFIEFQNKYRERGLTVIGVSMDEDGWTKVRPFIEKSGMNYPVVVGNEALAKRYSLQGMPMTVVIDRRGKMTAVHTGVVEKDAFEKELAALLETRNN